SDDPCHRSWPPLPARRRRARPQSLTAVAPAQHLSLAGQTGEPRRRYSPSAPEWPGPWQTPSVCHLESCRDRFGNPLRVSHSAAWYNMLYLASIWVIPIIVAITFHEAAHGFVAHRLGDETAWRLGRVSFNPLKHIDPIGTILLPGFLLLLHSPFIFGYAKPVPVNFRALHNPRRDMIWVAAAGPTMNIALAILAA